MSDHKELDAFWHKTKQQGPSDTKVPRLDMCRSISLIIKFENKGVRHYRRGVFLK